MVERYQGKRRGAGESVIFGESNLHIRNYIPEERDQVETIASPPEAVGSDAAVFTWTAGRNINTLQEDNARAWV